MKRIVNRHGIHGVIFQGLGLKISNFDVMCMVQSYLKSYLPHGHLLPWDSKYNLTFRFSIGVGFYSCSFYIILVERHESRVEPSGFRSSVSVKKYNVQGPLEWGLRLVFQ